jgi:hypothetical protein
MYVCATNIFELALDTESKKFNINCSNPTNLESF